MSTVPHRRSHKRKDPYVPGQFDRLLAEKYRLHPALSGVTLQVSPSGLTLIATEHTAGGAQPRRILVEYPAYFDIKLPDGREIQIEVSEFVRPMDAQNDVAGSVGAVAERKLTPGDLLRFVKNGRDGRNGRS